jgi:hypothetical protein
MPVVSFDDESVARPTLREVAGDFIETYATWSYWGTVTFPKPLSREAAFTSFTRFIRHISREMTRQHIHVAWTVESHRVEGHHVHFLLAAPPTGLTSREVNAAIRSHMGRGRTDLHAYDPTRAVEPRRGAAYYIAKTDRWNVNVVCPRTGDCKHRICAVALTHWRDS